MINYSEADRIRFWSKVDVKGDDDCWLWKAGINSDGYGNFYCSTTVAAHRMSWEMANGPIPDGKLCLHRRECKNRHCVNPNHLYIGDYSENNLDRECVNPGTSGRVSKLSASDIDMIKHMRNSGCTYEDISKLYPVSAAQVSRLCRGVSGSHSIRRSR